MRLLLSEKGKALRALRRRGLSSHPLYTRSASWALFRALFWGYSTFTKVLPGRPKCLPYQCPHRARLVPEIVPKVVPDPPLHSAQIILAFRKKDFYVFNGNVLGHYEGGIGHYFGLYLGSTEVLPGPPKCLPHQCPRRARLVPEIMPKVVPDHPPLHSAQIILACRKKDFYVF